MSGGFAYLAQGKLHVKGGDGAVEVIESQFGNSVRQRAQELQQRNAWKTQGRGAQFMRGGALWGGGLERDAGAMRIRVNSFGRGCGPGELLYTLDTPDVGGLFAVRDGGKDEQRLFHTADYRVGYVSASSAGKIAFVVEHRDGTSAIAFMGADGTDMAEVSQGDSMDSAPSWVPGSEHKIVFQSAGVARNAAGYPVGWGPASIHLLDMQAGHLQTLAEDSKHDLLGPHIGQDGTLFYIRRPYRDANAKVGLGRMLIDLVLLPFRLLFALFQYLNMFSMMYTGKTLTTAGGAAREADIQRMMIWGNLVDAQKAAREHGGRDDAPALVPKSWELVKQKGGAVEVIAKGVLSFDVGSDGSVIYSNGSGIFRVGANGDRERIHKDAMIEQVVAL